MKISDTKEILRFIKEAGIHPDPYSLTPAQLQELSQDAKLRERLLLSFQHRNRNFYQELEMDSPYINTHRDISYEPENLQLHSHLFYEIIYCESGDIQYLIGDKRYRIHRGDVILIPPGMSHRPIFYSNMTEPYSRIVLWISNDFVQQLTSACPNDTLFELHEKEHFILRTDGSSFKYLAQLFTRGVQEVSDDAPFSTIALLGNTITLLSHLSRAFISSKGTFKSETPEEIDAIISYVEKNYEKKITLESTAKEFHISISTLGKMFLSKMGISFYHFVTQRRLINAKIKIETGYSMEEAALVCGFCDYSSFYRSFKKEYGISPREYKKLILKTMP